MPAQISSDDQPRDMFDTNRELCADAGNQSQTDSITFVGQINTNTFDTLKDTNAFDTQFGSLNFGNQTDSLTFDVQTDSLAFDGQTDSLTFAGQTDSLNFDGQTDSLTFDNQTDSLTSDSQTDPVACNDAYSILWGNNQTIVQQTGGNTFLIEIERDDVDTQVQFEDQFDFTDNARIQNNKNISCASEKDVLTCENSLSNNRSLESGTENYSCGLNMLASVCEKLTTQPEASVKGLSIDSGTVALPAKEAGSQYRVENDLSDDLVSDTGSLCRIANTFSLASFSDRSAI